MYVVAFDASISLKATFKINLHRLFTVTASPEIRLMGSSAE